jgi:hypothetical protein
VPAVNHAVFHRRRAERFAQLLDEAGGGRRHHVRSRLDAQLAELVAIGHQTATLRPDVELDPEFRVGLRALLVATAEREGIGRTAQEAAEPAPAGRGGRRTPVPATPSRGRTRGAVIIGVAVGAIAVSGMSAASENAVPGDALYGVKRSTERAQLALASSDVTRGQLYLDFAHTRVAEAAAVRRDSDGFASVLDDMDTDTRQGVKLLTTAAVVRRDPAALEAITSFVTMQRLELGDLLDRVSPTNRSRTLRSLELLDDVIKRADGLRAGLSCGTSPSAGSDRLGPKPRQCVSQGPLHVDRPARPGQQRPEAGEAPAQPRPEASGDPTPTDLPDAPQASGDASAPATGTDPAPDQPAEPMSEPPAEDDGMLGEVGRVLGGLLGG